ncbi:SH3 domain-containing protein [Streptomyces prunicolor]
MNVRSGPGTGYRIVGTRPVGRALPIVCETRGSGVFGNHLWYKLPHHEGYVSAHYVRDHSAVRWC